MPPESVPAAFPKGSASLRVPFAYFSLPCTLHITSLGYPTSSTRLEHSAYSGAMAPTNDMNGPAIAFLTLSFILLLLLMLIWYRYLIWWNRKGGKKEFEQKRSSVVDSPDPRSPSKNRRPHRHRRPRSHHSLSPTNIMQGMPERFPADYREQPSAEAVAASRDERGTGGQNETRVDDLERELYPGGILRAENRKEQPQDSRRERRQNDQLFKPREELQGSSRRKGRRVSFAGREPEIQQRGGRDLSGQWEEHSDADHAHLEEEQEQEEPDRRSARDFSNEPTRPQMGREDVRDYRRNDTNSINAEKRSRHFGENEQQDANSLEEVPRIYRRPERHHARREDGEEYRNSSHREDSPRSTRDDEMEPGSRREKGFDEKHGAKELRKGEITDYSKKDGRDSQNGLYPERPDLENLDGPSYIEDNRRYTRDSKEPGDEEQGHTAGFSPPGGQGFHRPG